jgi:hypothetical protein
MTRATQAAAIFKSSFSPQGIGHLMVEVEISGEQLSRAFLAMAVSPNCRIGFDLLAKLRSHLHPHSVWQWRIS